MADFPAMPLFTDAYIADTQHLTNEEHGIYLRLLMFAWRTQDCALPNDDKRLATMVGLSVGRWTKIKPTILEFFTEDHGKLIQKKQKKVREKVKKQTSQKQKAANARWHPKSLKDKDTDDAGAEQPDMLDSSSRNANQNHNHKNVSKDTGSADPKKVLFDQVPLLMDWGCKSEKAARSMIGRLLKSCGEDPEAAYARILDAKSKAAPLDWLGGVLRRQKDDESSVDSAADALMESEDRHRAANQR